jgi:hypothetical protein
LARIRGSGATRNRVLPHLLPVRGPHDRGDRGRLAHVVHDHGPQRAGAAGGPGVTHERYRRGHPRGRPPCSSCGCCSPRPSRDAAATRMQAELDEVI